jgi:hypothetical protein
VGTALSCPRGKYINSVGTRAHPTRLGGFAVILN